MIPANCGRLITVIIRPALKNWSEERFQIGIFDFLGFVSQHCFMAHTIRFTPSQITLILYIWATITIGVFHPLELLLLLSPHAPDLAVQQTQRLSHLQLVARWFCASLLLICRFRIIQSRVRV